MQEGFETLPNAHEFWPWCVEEFVGEAIDPGRQFAGKLVCAIRCVPERVTVGQQQIEARVSRRIRLESLQKIPGRTRAGEVCGDQPATRRSAAPLAPELAKVGDDSEALAVPDGEPGAARLQIATTEDAGDVRPGRKRGGGPRVEFIAVGGDHQPVLRMAPPGED